MALPKTVDRLEILPEIVHDHYTQKDGVWTLTMLPVEDATALMTALDRERKVRRDAELAQTELKQRFEGVDPVEYATMRERLEGLKDKEIYDKDGLEALVGRRTNHLTAEHQRRDSAKDREIQQKDAQIKDLDTRWRTDRVKTALTEAAGRAGVAKYALQDVVSRGLTLFTELDDHGTPLAKDGGEIRYGKDGVKPLSPDDWVLGLKAEAPHYWPASGGGGAPAQHGNGSSGTIDWSKISSPTERLTAFRAAQAGTKG